MEHKWRVTNEAGESVVIITTSISNLPESFSLTEGKEMTDTVKIERIKERPDDAQMSDEDMAKYVAKLRDSITIDSPKEHCEHGR